MPSSSSPPLFLSALKGVSGRKLSPIHLKNKKLELVGGETLLCGAVNAEQQRTVVFFFFFFPPPLMSPAPISVEERGECHCYGNLIYHKRIPFVTEPYSLSKKGEKTTRERGEKNEKKLVGGRKECLSFASTFHLWSRLTKTGSTLFSCSQGNLQNEFSAKNKHKKTDRKDTKSTPPSS